LALNLGGFGLRGLDLLGSSLGWFGLQGLGSEGLGLLGSVLGGILDPNGNCVCPQ